MSLVFENVLSLPEGKAEPADRVRQAGVGEQGRCAHFYNPVQVALAYHTIIITLNQTLTALNLYNLFIYIFIIYR